MRGVVPVKKSEVNGKAKQFLKEDFARSVLSSLVVTWAISSFALATAHSEEEVTLSFSKPYPQALTISEREEIHRKSHDIYPERKLKSNRAEYRAREESNLIRKRADSLCQTAQCGKSSCEGAFEWKVGGYETQVSNLLKVLSKKYHQEQVFRKIVCVKAPALGAVLSQYDEVSSRIKLLSRASCQSDTDLSQRLSSKRTPVTDLGISSPSPLGPTETLKKRAQDAMKNKTGGTSGTPCPVLAQLAFKPNGFSSVAQDVVGWSLDQVSQWAKDDPEGYLFFNPTDQDGKRLNPDHAGPMELSKDERCQDKEKYYALSTRQMYSSTCFSVPNFLALNEEQAQKHSQLNFLSRWWNNIYDTMYPIPADMELTDMRIKKLVTKKPRVHQVSPGVYEVSVDIDDLEMQTGLDVTRVGFAKKENPKKLLGVKKAGIYFDKTKTRQPAQVKVRIEIGNDGKFVQSKPNSPTEKTSEVSLPSQSVFFSYAGERTPITGDKLSTQGGDDGLKKKRLEGFDSEQDADNYSWIANQLNHTMAGTTAKGYLIQYLEGVLGDLVVKQINVNSDYYLQSKDPTQIDISSLIDGAYGNLDFLNAVRAKKNDVLTPSIASQMRALASTTFSNLGRKPNAHSPPEGVAARAARPKTLVSSITPGPRVAQGENGITVLNWVDEEKVPKGCQAPPVGALNSLLGKNSPYQSCMVVTSNGIEDILERVYDAGYLDFCFGYDLKRNVSVSCDQIRPNSKTKIKANVGFHRPPKLHWDPSQRHHYIDFSDVDLEVESRVPGAARFGRKPNGRFIIDLVPCEFGGTAERLCLKTRLESQKSEGFPLQNAMAGELSRRLNLSQSLQASLLEKVFRNVNPYLGEGPTGTEIPTGPLGDVVPLVYEGRFMVCRP